MKNRAKQQKADYLLDEIGNIDDRFLTEAMSWQPVSRPKQSKKPIRVLLAAASLAAVMLLTFTVALSALLRNSDGNSDFEESNGSYADHAPTNLSALNSLLESCTQSPSFTLSSADALNFFDGNVRLTVQNCSTGEVYVSRPLSASEQSALSREFAATGEQVPASEPPSESAEAPGGTTEFRVWVMLGNGSVVTPCLSASEGNVGAAALFDYESERIPTKIFTDLLSKLD